MLPNKGGIVRAESLPDAKTACKYEPGDILLSNIRPYFCKIWFADREGSCSNDVLVIKAKDGWLPKFIYYVLSDQNFFNYDSVTSKGTKMPRGTKNAIMKYFVPDINMTEQQKIVDVLSKYDSLIEANKKRIQNLQDQAAELYKEWFVRFRYPSDTAINLVDSPIGMLPEGFRVLKMKDVVSYYIGGGWGNENSDTAFCEYASVIRGTDFPFVAVGDVSTCPGRWHKKSNYKPRALQLNDIILEVSGGTAEQPVGRIILVSQNILDKLSNRVICASFCKLVRINQKVVSPLYLYYWLQYVYDTRIIDRFQLQSTGIINFKFEYFLRKCDVMLPPKQIIEEFENQIKPLRELIEGLTTQNEQSKQQRDALLPKLLSGRVIVYIMLHYEESY